MVIWQIQIYFANLITKAITIYISFAQILSVSNGYFAWCANFSHAQIVAFAKICRIFGNMALIQYGVGSAHIKKRQRALLHLSVVCTKAKKNGKFAN